jgi:SOS response regulatory protein OraA/RecX
LIARGDSPRMVVQRLARQGISGPDARAAAEEAREGAGDDELAVRALRRKLRGRTPPAENDEREKRRLLRSLIAKGHRPGSAARALNIEWSCEDDVESSLEE